MELFPFNHSPYEYTSTFSVLYLGPLTDILGATFIFSRRACALVAGPQILFNTSSKPSFNYVKERNIYIYIYIEREREREKLPVR